MEMKLRQALKGFEASMTTGRKIAKFSLRLSLFCVIIWAAFGFVFIITYEIIEHHKSRPVSEINLPPGFELEVAERHKSRPVPEWMPEGATPVEITEPEKKWTNDENILAIAFFSVVAVVIFIISFGLTYLGGHIVNGNIGATRLGIVISLLLILGLNPFLLSLYDTDWISYEGLAVFMGIVVMPMLIYWGLLWIIKGFLRKATL